MIHGSQYRHGEDLYRLIGVRSSTAVFERESDGERVIVDRKPLVGFQETGVHDHEHFCCSEHNTHVSPHQGCILR